MDFELATDMSDDQFTASVLSIQSGLEATLDDVEVTVERSAKLLLFVGEKFQALKQKEQKQELQSRASDDPEDVFSPQHLRGMLISLMDNLTSTYTHLLDKTKQISEIRELVSRNPGKYSTDCLTGLLQPIERLSSVVSAVSEYLSIAQELLDKCEPNEDCGRETVSDTRGSVQTSNKPVFSELCSEQGYVSPALQDSMESHPRDFARVHSKCSLRKEPPQQHVPNAPKLMSKLEEGVADVIDRNMALANKLKRIRKDTFDLSSSLLTATNEASLAKEREISARKQLKKAVKKQTELCEMGNVLTDALATLRMQQTKREKEREGVEQMEEIVSSLESEVEQLRIQKVELNRIVEEMSAMKVRLAALTAQEEQKAASKRKQATNLAAISVALSEKIAECISTTPRGPEVYGLARSCPPRPMGTPGIIGPSPYPMAMSAHQYSPAHLSSSVVNPEALSQYIAAHRAALDTLQREIDYAASSPGVFRSSSGH